jgi:hypothetical protein
MPTIQVSRLESHSLSIQSESEGLAAQLQEEREKGEAARRQWAARLNALPSTSRCVWCVWVGAGSGLQLLTHAGCLKSGVTLGPLVGEGCRWHGGRAALIGRSFLSCRIP